uniref:Integrase catalytic domain-containing protein n=1 Tax=Lactuca sativa TaxID=4236 RepID=A0A9R1W283_LACSA|nr:hypothetical protein LSAT_V11C400207050 [Lactuca sativa]
MKFLVTTLKVVYVLSTPMPVLPESVQDEPLEVTRRKSKWENNDYICRGHILDGMSDSLFDIYENFESAKELWDSLESKYMAEDASSKKFLELPLTQIGSHLRIDESIRTQELDNNPKGKNQVGSSSVNMVEGETSKNPKKSNGKKKFKGKDDKSSNKKAKLVCLNCNKPSHFKKDYRLRKVNKDGVGPSGSKDPKKQQGQISVFMQNSKYIQNYISVISEVFYVLDDKVAWWVDSGATSHVCKDIYWFKDFQPIEDGSVVKMGNVATEPIKGIGSVLLTFTSGKCLCLNNVLYVPGIRKNLVSEIVLNNCGYKQVLESDKYILSRHGSFMGFGYICNGMIRVNINYPYSDNSVCMASSSTSNNFHKSKLWHARLGHIHYNRLKDMSKMSLIPAFDMQNNEKCKTCMLTKITRQPFKDVVRESKVLDLIHSDLCDFHTTPSLGNKKYVVTFIDDASRYCYIYLLHSKDEALDKFKIYKQQVELHKNELIKVLRTDRGGEYYDPVYFESTRKIHQTIAPYTPQENGVAKRKNRTLKEMVNSMLSYSGLSEGFWGEAIKSTTQAEDVSGGAISVPDPRKSTRARKAKSFGSDFQLYLVEGTRNEIICQHQYCFNIEEDPKTFSEAMASRDIHFLKEAILDEIDSIMHNNTWVLPDLPPGYKALECKWILKRKMMVDGTIDKYKARMVTQGFRQKEGNDYFDTYALVAKISNIRLLLALATIHNLVIHQMDVKTAFLNGDLEEEIYMKQPEGFVKPGNEHKQVSTLGVPKGYAASTHALNLDAESARYAGRT